MKLFKQTLGWAMAAALLAGGMAWAEAPSPNSPAKRVLVVTGQDYPGHDWKHTAPVLEKALAADPRLEVSLTEQPSDLAKPLDAYDVIVLHFMDWEQPDPGEQARANLKRFVEEGGGLCLVHFACGAFQEWPEFRNLAGRVWDPQLRGHDPHGSFRVDIVSTTHPITQGLEGFETTDELYTCLVGDRPIELLATSRSSVDGKDYPMAFTFSYGKGRVFHCPLGHDVPSLERPPVGELFQRGCAWAAGLEPAWRPKRVLLIAGKDSHGEGAHAHEAGVKLLEECLEASPDAGHLDVEAVAGGWPKDPAVLENIDCLVVYADGFEGHPLFATPEAREKTKALMQQGVGLVCLHFAVAPPRNADDEKQMLEWLGGYYKDGYSKNPVCEAPAAPASADHPISQGLTPYSAREEFYFDIMFGPDEAAAPATPILNTQLPLDNPQEEVIAWAHTRPDGGRSFGFTGGHFHATWAIESYRKMVLNAILWATSRPVPEGGVTSSLPSQ